MSKPAVVLEGPDGLPERPDRETVIAIDHRGVAHPWPIGQELPDGWREQIAPRRPEQNGNE